MASVVVSLLLSGLLALTLLRLWLVVDECCRRGLVLGSGHVLLQKVHSTHLKLLDRGHVNLGHVVLFVARVYVLCDGLCFLHDKVGSHLVLLLTVNGTRWLIEAILFHIVVVLGRLSLIAVVLLAQLGCRLGYERAIQHLN